MTSKSRLLAMLIGLSSSTSWAATGYHCDFIRADAQGHEVRRASGSFVFKGKSYLSLAVTRNAAILELSPDGHQFHVSIGSTVSSRDRQFDHQISVSSFSQLPDHFDYHVEAFTETAIAGAEPFQLHLACKKPKAYSACS